ncbi:ribose 5-phosphate isomerase A [Candidatus Pantoea edessiphila]|uniref:Ribose-5-phosphate isomerase A n=1 Tax=Candidatus Pantoea edessiphila TaxID=2044610 RepID=A0A2P5SXK2_9GAMM|nr:ribose-5-phosphate isomerase RpiA [Candidatus Pantoea edessiphila]MBK4775703.1 ribose-5-phosphate isomerase RpiA [Pantoea sp. Edef]PPI87066.1 ribose 5-phosphate isomerase A [Candidatus Pantoea edessiphila]
MDQNSLKKAVGLAAVEFIQPDTIVGIGTGSTINYFINSLSSIKFKIKGVVSSSEQSTNKLRNFGIKIINLNELKFLPLYIDSADEIDPQMCMIKGGGAALTSEKIIASVAEKFICIVDVSKKVNILGKFPVPIEVIGIARGFVTRELEKIGGIVKYRRGIITDHGNIILDIYNLSISNPILLEQHINSIPGVVTVGIFASRKADILLVSDHNGINTIIK